MIPNDQYVDDCCAGKLTPALPEGEESQTSQPATNEQWPESSKKSKDPMEYGTSRPFKTCTLKSRILGGSSNQYTNSAYKCLQDFPQGGKVEIEKRGKVKNGKTVEEDAWATTRWVKAISHSRNEAGPCHQCMSPIFQPWIVRRS